MIRASGEATMSNGPITIFDKSAIQMLNVDEAALFGQFYRVAITPLFFVETLADLEKDINGGKTPEDVVGIIASKTANLTADPSAHHTLLVLNDLHGGEIEMDGRPHVVGGRSVVRDGKRGIVFDKAPEAEALHRWQRHEFLEIERGIAKQWRENLRAHQIRKVDPARFFPQNRPRTFAEVKLYADAYIRREGGQAFVSALNLLSVPQADRGPVLSRWLDLGSPPISLFAPYAAYVATVTLFFELAVSLSMISDQRPSNAVDIAYCFTCLSAWCSRRRTTCTRRPSHCSFERTRSS